MGLRSSGRISGRQVRWAGVLYGRNPQYRQKEK